MEQLNSQLKSKKKTLQRATAFVGTAVICCLLVMVSACSMLPDRYLFPTAQMPGMMGKESGIVFQGFSEDFLKDNEIGIHRIGSRQQKLKTMTGELAQALDSLVARGLAEKGHAMRYVDQKIWELTVDDLANLPEQDRIVLGGRITRLWVTASTVQARVATEYEFLAEIDCYIGQVGEKKVVERTVLLEHKMLNFSWSQKTMDKLLNDFLQEAAVQVVQNVESFL